MYNKTPADIKPRQISHCYNCIQKYPKFGIEWEGSYADVLTKRDGIQEPYHSMVGAGLNSVVFLCQVLAEA
jgi:hypothetical protein